jgi:hypothetical protein
MASALLAVGCGGGGSSAQPPSSGLTVTSTAQSTATVTWTMEPGVEYWLFYAPTALAPTNTTSADKWIGIPGGNTIVKAASPATIPNLVNGTSYSFTINGRKNGGPGGPILTPVTVTPQAAGTQWVASSPNPMGTQDLHGVGVGNAYVAVGDKGAMFASADGVNWGPINPITTNNLKAVAYTAASGYYAVGDNGTLLRSTDAISWTPQSTGSSVNFTGVATNGTTTIIVGSGGTILTSTDGVTWTPPTLPATSADLLSATFLGGAFYASGVGGTLVYSSDGQTWVTRTTNTTADLRAVSYGSSLTSASGAVFLAGGANGTLVTSTDGLAWTVQTLPVSDIYAIELGLQFVIVGAGGAIFTSPDGLTWTALNSPTTNTLYALGYGSGNGTFVSVGAKGTSINSH